MKSNKFLLSLTLALTMLLTLLVGCGSNKDLPTTSASDDPAANSADGADSTAFSYSEGIDENGFFEGINALDYVEDFKYKGFLIPSDIHKVSDEDLQSEIDNILNYYSSDEQITDRAVVDGDTVNIDYVGSVDGIKFDGGSTGGEGTDVTIGVTQYIDDFLEQLIGHMPGETIDVEVTFPDDYGEESLQGKDALFVTTINYIVETVQAELTDEFIGANLSSDYGWTTVTEMKEELYKELQTGAVEEYVYQYMANDVTVSSVPDKLTEYLEKAMVQYYKSGAEYYSMDFEEFLSTYMGLSSEAELLENNRESNTSNAKYTLAALMVAKNEGITVTEEEMTAYYGDYAEYEAQYGLPYLKQIVLFQNVIDFIVENAVFE